MMQMNREQKPLLTKCIQRLRIFVAQIADLTVGILAPPKEYIPSEDVLDAEYEVIEDA